MCVLLFELCDDATKGWVECVEEGGDTVDAVEIFILLASSSIPFAQERFRLKKLILHENI